MQTLSCCKCTHHPEGGLAQVVHHHRKQEETNHSFCAFPHGIGGSFDHRFLSLPSGGALFPRATCFFTVFAPRLSIRSLLPSHMKLFLQLLDPHFSRRDLPLLRLSLETQSPRAQLEAPRVKQLGLQPLGDEAVGVEEGAVGGKQDLVLLDRNGDFGGRVPLPRVFADFWFWWRGERVVECCFAGHGGAASCRGRAVVVRLVESGEARRGAEVGFVGQRRDRVERFPSALCVFDGGCCQG
ncbi:hypothetical protein IWX46DRAFT_597073 [Phyllosticta citricarpa]